jgi:PhnB protein
MKVQPYLFFEGRAEEAIEFYRRAIDAKPGMMMRYKDSPEAPPPGMVPPGSDNKIMHAEMQVGDTLVMVSDGMVSGKPSFKGFSLAIDAPDVATLDKQFAALSEGGKVEMPLGKTFWSPRFGMLTDKFGVGWMLGVAEKK